MVLHVAKGRYPSVTHTATFATSSGYKYIQNPETKSAKKGLSYISQLYPMVDMTKPIYDSLYRWT